MSVSITLSFADYAAASEALAKLAGTIAPADRPDVGAPPAPAPVAPPALDPAAVFGGAAVPAAPTVPVPPVAPAATTPSAATAPTGVLLDSKGMPWDARIHAGNKATNQDGSWRARRGLNDPALVARIEAELRAAAGTVPPAAAPAAPAATLGAAALVPPPVGVPTPPAAPPVPPAAPAGEGFGQFMARVAPLLAADPAGATAKMTQALATVGLSTVAQLATAQQHIGAVAATFDALMATP